MHPSKRRFYLYLLLSFALSAAAGVLTGGYGIHRGLASLSASSRLQAVRYGGALEREIGKFGVVPLTVSLDRGVIDFLSGPRDAGTVSAMDRHLQAVNASIGAQRTYLIDPQGTIVASSNWDAPDTFVGRNIAYRPYFQDAKAGRISRYYAIGTTGNASGYYLATAVQRDGRALGVVAVKVGLEQLEHLWQGVEKPVLLADANNVVVLSSELAWKYRVLGPFSAQEQQRLNASQQYNQHPLAPLGWRERLRLDADSALYSVTDGPRRGTYLGLAHRLPALSMRMTVLADPRPVAAMALSMGAAAALAVAFAMVLLHSLRLWHQSVRERLDNQARLQAAHDALEQLVEQRSAQLLEANAGLTREIAERTQAVTQLQAFQQELIRTENLAVIGQLSAGLAHEINQPLAALGTLSANAVRFLERGDLDTVRANLGRIVDLVARLGTLSGQLRSFARRSNGSLSQAPLAASVEAALALLAHRMGKGVQRVQVDVLPPPQPLSVHCDPVRLEQVLLNLVGNAIDATAGQPQPRIEIAWRAQDAAVLLEVRDNGTGLSPEVAARLFEPFFTTKSHSGLGLGLAISADIIKGFGGTLSARNRDDGQPGAVFVIALPLEASTPLSTGQSHGQV